MKAHLMFRDRDFDLQAPSPANADALVQDLELLTLFYTMAQGDRFLYDVARKALLLSLTDLDEIRFRQDVLKDCLDNPAIIREIYSIPLQLIETRKKHYYGIFSNYPTSILSSAIEILLLFVELLKKLRAIADEHAGKFASEGFQAFFAMIQKELDDDYFACVEGHLKALKFRYGVLISARLGRGSEGAGYMLRKPHNHNPDLVERIFAKKGPVYSFRISDRDEAGSRTLQSIKDQGVNQVANALAQSADHIESFFNLLRAELAFYLGCINLSDRLAGLEEPLCFPQPEPAHSRVYACTGLYDVCLALTMNRKVVGNDICTDGKDLLVITGANQGGKSTFLRSLGLAQLMLQCGMFAPAEALRASLCGGLFTHYRRKEDASMKSGKLDEELSRMSDLVDQVAPDAMILFNESFSATNEREGSEIARQITDALLEGQVRVCFVTHLYEFAHSLYRREMPNALFLRADRQPDGERSFKLVEGRPLGTSFGEDLYNQVFEAGASGGLLPLGPGRQAPAPPAQ